MTFDKFMTQGATLKRLDNTTDRYNNIVKEFESEATINVRVDDQSSTEEEINAGSTNKVAKIFTRYQDINAHDIIEVDGVVWKVIGEPIIKLNGNGTIHHLEINAEKVSV